MCCSVCARMCSGLLMQAKACSVLPPKTLVVMGDSMDMLLQGDLNSILSSFRAAAVDWLPHLPKIDNSHNRIPSNNSNRNQLPRMLHAAEFGIWPDEFKLNYEYLMAMALWAQLLMRFGGSKKQ